VVFLSSIIFLLVSAASGDLTAMIYDLLRMREQSLTRGDKIRGYG